MAQKAKVLAIGDKAPAQRLAAMGIRVGAEIQILSTTTGAGLLVKVEENRVAISRALADQIEVETFAMLESSQIYV